MFAQHKLPLTFDLESFAQSLLELDFVENTKATKYGLRVDYKDGRSVNIEARTTKKHCKLTVYPRGLFDIFHRSYSTRAEAILERAIAENAD